MFNIDQLFAEVKEGTIQQPESLFPQISEKYKGFTDLITQGRYAEYLMELDKVNLDTYGNHMDRLSFLVALVIAFKDSPDNGLKERAINLTIDKWKSPQDDDPAGVLSDLVNSILCPTDALKALFNYYEDVSPVELIEAQITHETNLALDLLLNRIEEIFKDRSSTRNVVTDTELSYLKFIAEKYQNKSVLIWLDSKIHGVLEVAEKPWWVDIKEGENEDCLNMDLWKAIDEKATGVPPVSTEGVMNILKDQYSFTRKGDVVDDETLVQIADTALKSAVFTGMLNNALNPELKYPCDPDRMFGPLNRKANGEECVSGIKGGCRMLSCRDRDYDQSSDEIPSQIDPEGWFTGICDACERKISDISYALRYPVVGGGFIGEFCSVDCLKIKPSREPNQVSEFILDNIFSVIEEKGIVDRLQIRRNAEQKEEDDFEGDEGDEGETPADDEVEDVAGIEDHPPDPENFIGDTYYETAQIKTPYAMPLPGVE